MDKTSATEVVNSVSIPGRIKLKISFAVSLEFNIKRNSLNFWKVQHGMWKTFGQVVRGFLSNVN